jgi:hypothetical protein
MKANGSILSDKRIHDRFPRFSPIWNDINEHDSAVLGLAAIAGFFFLSIVIILTASQYGFHRDELNFIENARHLDWGFVEYPPLTSFIAWIVICIFGTSLIALRMVAALMVLTAAWITGLMALEFGGSRTGQVYAMVAAITAPVVLFTTRFFSYQTLDYLWWVLAFYLVVRLLKTDNPKWWLSIGAVLGLGIMTKYSIPFLVPGMMLGVLLTPARKYLKNRWLWAGALLAMVIFLPNLIWQIQHHLISLDFQMETRTRNIELGRTQDFLIQQFYLVTNPAVIILCANTLLYCLVKPEGKAYRLLGWMFVVPFILFIVAQGRSYYMAGAYPMLIALGASRIYPIQQSPDTLSSSIHQKKIKIDSNFGGLLLSGVLILAVVIPIAKVGSTWWNFDAQVNSEIKEEIGWPELVREVGRIYSSIPGEERKQTGIIAFNYGEAGAINLYGAAYGLPEVVSPVNTYWLRGYRNSPQTVIVLGLTKKYVDMLFTSCQLPGNTPNPFHIENEETRDHPDIFLCRGTRDPWPEIWPNIQSFG